MTTGLFDPMKHKYLADMISLKSPDKALESVKKLKQEFASAVTPTKKLRVARATQLAANRAKVNAQRSSLSPFRRSDFRKIHVLYDAAAGKMFAAYTTGINNKT